MSELPKWPHSYNGKTAQITGMHSTEYLPTFDSLFQAIDGLMQNEHNSYTYESSLDGGSSALNWKPLQERFDGMLYAGINDLSDRLSYYSQADNPYQMTLAREAKTAITRAGGRYSESENHIIVFTPGGWYVTYPEPYRE